MLCDRFLPHTLSGKSKRKRQLNDLVMKKEKPMRVFARADKIVGVLGSLGVYLPVEDVNLKIVEALTAEYEAEQSTIFFKDDITRAETEAIARQRYIITSRSTSTKNCNVGQALVVNKHGRRNRKQHGNGKGVAGNDVSGGVDVAKNDNNSRTKDGERKSDDMRNKCRRCLEPGHRWFYCTAHVIPAAKKSPNGSGDVIGCLAISMSGKRDAVGEREQSNDGNKRG